MIREVSSILFGAAFTVAVSLAMGMLLLQKLRPPFFRYEAALFGFVSGSACLSLFTFFLCLIHQARWQVFLPAGAAAITAALWQNRRQPPRKPLPAPDRSWSIFCFLIFAAFFIAYFFNALAPEVSPDGSGYHLGNVASDWRMRGFDWNHRNMYAYLSQGAEMLFLVAFCFGGHSSAALVHFAFLTALPLLIVCYALRLAFPRVGMFAAILVYCSPIVGLDGISAYNDVALVTVIFAVFYLLQVFYEVNDIKILVLIGLLCGYTYAIKYTGGVVTLPFALGYACWRSPRARTALVLLLAASVMILPWVLRNWIWVGNPFAPFLNAWFPNPNFHAGNETRYLADLRHYEGLNHWWELPAQLTVRGGLAPGILGPAFLLAPLALWSLRLPQGRRLLLAAVVFALPAYFNTGSRFLIPGLPFLALALGLALANSRGVLPLIALFQALVCWPDILSMYTDPGAWHLRSIPVSAALRREPEAAFLVRHFPDLALRDAVAGATAPADRILSFAARPEAYFDREIITGYESSLGNLAQDVVWTAAGVLNPPADQLTFRLPAVKARAVRLLQNAKAGDDWTVAEVTLYCEGREVAPAPGWHITARPNPTEAVLAFDRNLLTRWSTWEPMTARDYLEVDFSNLEKLDEVRLRTAGNYPAQVSVEVLEESGQWRLQDSRLEIARVAVPDLKLLAMRQLKLLGIHYLLIGDGDFGASDINHYSKSWGITELAEANGTHFFRID